MFGIDSQLFVESIRKKPSGQRGESSGFSSTGADFPQALRSSRQSKQIVSTIYFFIYFH